MPAPARFGEGHPAKRVFQALRIEVNDELGALERALPAALEMLRPHGRLAVISFHSLEDRIVKRFLRDEEHGCTCPPDFPVCACGSTPTLRAIPRRAIRPSAAEIARNPRSAVGAAPRGGEAWLARASRPSVARRPRPRSAPAQPATEHAAEAEAGAAAAPRGSGRARAPRSRAGIAWIVVGGLLLAGVVFVNLAVLRLNLRLDSATQQRTQAPRRQRGAPVAALVVARVAADPVARARAARASSRPTRPRSATSTSGSR